MRGAAAAILLAGALAVAGCGQSDEDKITEVLKDYNAALVDGDGAKACGLFDDAGQKRLAASLKQLVSTSQATDCEQLVRDVSATISAENGKRIKALKITKIKVDGDKARAQSGVATQLVKDGGDWKITDFEGSSSADAQGAPKGCTKVAPPKAGQEGKRKAPTTQLSTSSPPTVTVATNCGTFAFRLDPKASPKAAASVYELAKDKFYDDTVFHRIVPGFVIQGGDPTGTGSGGAGYTTVDKPAASTTYPRGTVAMAKGGDEPAGAASSQFFVVTGARAELPPDYAVVGHVTSGQDVVTRIGTLGDQQERPTFLVAVKSMTASQ